MAAHCGAKKSPDSENDSPHQMYHPLIPSVTGWRRPLIGMSAAVDGANSIVPSGGVLTNAASYRLHSTICASSILWRSMVFTDDEAYKTALNARARVSHFIANRF